MGGCGSKKKVADSVVATVSDDNKPKEEKTKSTPFEILILSIMALEEFERLSKEDLLRWFAVFIGLMIDSHESRISAMKIGILNLLNRIGESKEFGDDLETVSRIHQCLILLLKEEDNCPPVMDLWISFGLKRNSLAHQIAFGTLLVKLIEEKKIDYWRLLQDGRIITTLVKPLNDIDDGLKDYNVSLITQILENIDELHRKDVVVQIIKAGYIDFILSSWNDELLDKVRDHTYFMTHILSTLLYITDEYRSFAEKDHFMSKKVIPVLILIAENKFGLIHILLNGLIQITSDLVSYNRVGIDKALLSSNILNMIVRGHIDDNIAEQLTFDATIDMITSLVRRSLNKVDFRVPCDMLAVILEQYIENSGSELNSEFIEKTEQLIKLLNKPEEESQISIVD